MALVVAGSLADQYRAGSIWQAENYGYLAMNFDVAIAGGNSTVLTPAGTLYVIRIPVRTAMLVTNIATWLTTAGVGLTTGQCFAALYQGGALKAQTADQAAAWGSTGLKTMALSSPQWVGPQSGVDLAFWFNGTTGPALLRGNSQAAILLGAASPNIRMAKANAAITTTAPANLTTETGEPTIRWAAIS